MDGDTSEEVESEVETDFQDSQRVLCLDLETPINAEEQRGARMDGDTSEEVESEVETDFQDSQRVLCLDLETPINAEEQRGARMDGDTREEVESEVETDFQDSQRVPCLDLETLINAEEQRFKELAFVKGYTGLDKRPVYVVTQRELFDYPPFGYTSRINVTLKGNDYVINSLGFHVESGTITSDDDIHELCQRFSKQSSHKFCPGIDWNLYEQKYYRVIRYHLKSVRYSTSPFQRVDSEKCPLWYKQSAKARASEKYADDVMCTACKRLKTYLDWQLKRTMAESPSRKVKRQAPSSKAKLSYMSPASQLKRKQNSTSERNNDKKKLRKYENTEVTLADDQHEDMCNVMKTIEEVSKADLEKLFAEGDIHGVGDKVREVWCTDRRHQLEQFHEDQTRNVTGKRSNQWSLVTIRIALAVYSRSPAAYEALKSFKLFQLPSKSTLQAYTGAFLHEPGASQQCIADQVAQFVIFKSDCVKQGKHVPQGDGVVIFDEVKVACQLMWNSRNQKLSGLAMTGKDLCSLNDIYRFLQQPESPKQTSYILQFLWRDLTSNYDIIGPYFTSSDSVDSQFILTCMLETLKLFQCHGLKTSLLVCDGSPANLATIKRTHGHVGAYSVLPDTTTGDKFAVKPFMINPFDPPNRIYWVVCPTHQLKNMINALFSSKCGGTKLFKRGQEHCMFGWETIIELYRRDVARAKQQLTRMVPRLKEVHCVRDSWTKLNVSPAKIMQQEQVLGELFWYVHQHPSPLDSDTTNETLQYLQACHNLFERGFLSHEKITSMESAVLKNIDTGYKYFSAWITTLLTEDSDFPHTSSTQKAFHSWQTWDLLRICVYGFSAFCEDFLKKYPGYFVSPLRISGSAVESLFSQYKYNAGGKLDACNYITARCANLVQQTSLSHHSGVGYRDETLTSIQLPLNKKSYGSS